MRRIETKMENQTSTLVDLYSQHQIFHRYLDKLVLTHEDMSTIDMLIAVRQLNLNCLNKYADLISRRQISGFRSKESQGQVNRLSETDMTLWNIHAQLSRLVPFYAIALRNKNLNQVSRFIISHNYDQLIKMKEDLLHPVEEEVEMN